MMTLLNDGSFAVRDTFAAPLGVGDRVQTTVFVEPWRGQITGRCVDPRFVIVCWDNGYSSKTRLDFLRRLS